MRHLRLLFLILWFVSCQPKRFDLIISQVTIIDGSGKAGYVGDVGINEDTIAAVGDLSNESATISVDGTGLAIAPGFIDTHSHHDWGLDNARDAHAVVSQGITTIIVGQDGGSTFPLGKYFRQLSDTPVAVNIGSYSGHNSLRELVMGSDFRRLANVQEVGQMVELLKDDMEAGALGLSTGLEYDPGIYSNESEVMTLAKAVRPYNGRYISHLRSEDRYFWDALNEIITIGREAKIPVQISHLKLAMRSLWYKADTTLQLLETARDQGIDVTADIYPYTYWSSTIRVLFPDRNFKDLKEADFILKEVASPDGIIFNNYEPTPAYNGKSLAEVAALKKSDASRVLLELISALDDCDKKLGVACDGSIVATSMVESDVRKLMQWKHTSICSDGASSGRHPRGFGAFTRVLGHYVRESEALTLEEAIRKMTSLSADNLGIKRRGMLKSGYYADLVLFDPEQVTDKATIQDPQAPSIGISKVWVNGKEVYNEQGTTQQFPGRVILRDSN